MSAISQRLVIRRSQSLLEFDFASLWEYRDLLLLLVRRDFVSKYTQTVLGPAWFVIQPVLTTLVFSVIFGKVAQIPTQGVPPALFYMCGLLPWNYFAQNFSATAVTLIAQAGLFTKVYFPRLIVPLAAIVSNLCATLIQLVTFFGFFAFYKFGTAAGDTFAIQWQVVFFPLLFLQVAAFSLGVGLLMSALTAKYRDLQHLSSFLIQLWLYSTPVIYPLERISEKWQWLILLNPMTMPVEACKFIFLGVGTIHTGVMLSSIGMTLAVLLSGLIVFKRVERTFVDIV